MQTYAQLTLAAGIVADHRGIARTDGPALLALSRELYPSLTETGHQLVALSLFQAKAGATLVPSMAAA